MPVGSSLVLESPAKVNLGLEVLHRRPDGFHEIATIMQTVDLVDQFRLERDGYPFRYCGPPEIPPDRDLVSSVFGDVDEANAWHGKLSLAKSIPEATGLGGGSSNAASALRLAFPAASSDELHERAATIGSDVPFFISGGCALATGRGTRLQTLPDRVAWYVLVIPDLRIEAKTKSLYQNLSPEDFSSGERVVALANALRQRARDVDRLELPPNAFERQLRSYNAVEECWQELSRVAGRRPQVSGAGPALYVRFSEEPSAHATHERVKQRFQSYLCRSRVRGQDIDDARRMAIALRTAEGAT